MYCQPNKGDHPGRARMESTGYRGVVHAVRNVGSYRSSGRSTNLVVYPSACGLFLSRQTLISNTEEITCKNCQRALGFYEKRRSNLYYVLYDRVNKLYFCNELQIVWTDSLLFATRWLTKQAAMVAQKRILGQRFLAQNSRCVGDINKRKEFVDKHRDELEIQTVQLEVSKCPERKR